MTAPSEYLTIDEAAALLRVDPKTLKKAIKRGDVPVVDLGERSTRIRRQSLLDLEQRLSDEVAT